jgi:hypothetical protein
VESNIKEQTTKKSTGERSKEAQREKKEIEGGREKEGQNW